MEEEKPRSAGVEGDKGERVFLKLSEALMCLRPAESKEIENLWCTRGSSDRRMQEKQTQDGWMASTGEVRGEGGILM